MDVSARVWTKHAALLLAAAVSACSRSVDSPTPAASTGNAQIQNVRAGGRAGQLLLTTCRGGRPETCTLTLVDTERRKAVEYAAPAGGSIKDASIANGSVLAVVIRPQADANGNQPSSIVSFSPGEDRLAVRRREPVQMRFPAQDDGRLVFWRRDCRSPAERYCQHDLFAQTGPESAVIVGLPHRFAEVDEIMPQRAGMIVNAGYPADGVADGNRYLDYAGSTAAWRLAPGQPFGLARLAGDKDVLKAMSVPGGLLLLAQDEGGIALFKQVDERLERVVGLPPATKAMSALVVRDVTVSADGRHVAMIVGGADSARPATVFTMDLANRRWRAVDPSALVARRTIVLKE